MHLHCIITIEYYANVLTGSVHPFGILIFRVHCTETSNPQAPDGVASRLWVTRKQRLCVSGSGEVPPTGNLQSPTGSLWSDPQGACQVPVGD